MLRFLDILLLTSCQVSEKSLERFLIRGAPGRPDGGGASRGAGRAYHLATRAGRAERFGRVAIPHKPVKTGLYMLYVLVSNSNY